MNTIRRKAQQRLLLPVLMASVMLAIAACTGNTSGGTMNTPSSDASTSVDGSRPAKVIFPEYLDTIDDTVKHSGTTFPQFDKADRSGYKAEACGVHTREDGRQYTVQIEGGPVINPSQAIESMKAQWESRGYKIGNIFPQREGGTSSEIAAHTPSGMLVVYTAGTVASFIKVVSDCTIDPAARDVTTATIP